MKSIQGIVIHLFFAGFSAVAGGVLGFFLGLYVRRGYWQYPENSIYASDNFLLLTAGIGGVLGLAAYWKLSNDLKRSYAGSKGSENALI